MKIFERFRAALRAKNPKAADLLSHVRDARAALQTAEAQRDALRARRADMLTASDVQRVRYKADLAAAEDAAEDAALFVQELEARHGKAEALEAEAARVSAYDAAKAKAAAVAELLAREYPEIGRRYAELLHQVADAEAAVRAANDALPDGASRLVGPESLVRDEPALPREILSDGVEDRWCIIRDGAGPFAQELVDRDGRGDAKIQRTGDRTGLLPPPPNAYPRQGTPVELRPYRRIEYLPEQPSHSGARLADLEFPGLRCGDRPFWKPKGYGRVTPDETQANLDAIRAGDLLSEPTRRDPKVEWTAVRTEAVGEPG